MEVLQSLNMCWAYSFPFSYSDWADKSSTSDWLRWLVIITQPPIHYGSLIFAWEISVKGAWERKTKARGNVYACMRIQNGLYNSNPLVLSPIHFISQSQYSSHPLVSLTILMDLHWIPPPNGTLKINVHADCLSSSSP